MLNEGGLMEMYQLTIFVTEDEMHLVLDTQNITDSKTVHRFFEGLGYSVEYADGKFILSRLSIHNTEQDSVLKRMNNMIALTNEMYQFLK